jgi:hypothetical protein
MVFVLGEPFQLSLMFVGKTESFPFEEPLRCSRLLALPSNSRLGWKGLPGTNTLAYYENEYITYKKVL